MLTFTSEKDLPVIIKTLTSMFNHHTHELRGPSRTAEVGSTNRHLYQWQVDFAYKLHDIQTSPNYIKQKVINSCVEYVLSVGTSVKEIIK